MWALEILKALNADSTESTVIGGPRGVCAIGPARDNFSLETRARKAQARRKALSGGKVVPRNYYEGGRLVGRLSPITNTWLPVLGRTR
jgi:hypothetical protein